MNKFIMIALLTLSSSAYAGVSKTCDVTYVAQYKDGQSEITIPTRKQSVTVNDNGRQFDVVFGKGKDDKLTSPQLSPVAKGVLAGNHQDSSGMLRFIKREGMYQITDDGIEFMVMHNCKVNQTM